MPVPLQASFIGQLCASHREAHACRWSGAACASLTTFQAALAAPSQPSNFCRCNVEPWKQEFVQEFALASSYESGTWQPVRLPRTAN